MQITKEQLGYTKKSKFNPFKKNPHIINDPYSTQEKNVGKHTGHKLTKYYFKHTHSNRATIVRE